MKLELLVPEAGTVELDAVLDRLRAPQASLPPFAEVTSAFMSRLSRELFRSSETSGVPEVQALAFWMRRAELHRLEDQYKRLADPGTVLVPRGTVFHVPPTNVGTIFVYSWVFAALTGNRSVIRLSPKARLADRICSVVRRLLDAPEFRDLRPMTTIVRYGHEQEVTDALSSVADVRVIWGGDASVRAIRMSSIPPHAIELTFPDRWSLALIDARAYCALNEEDRRRVASALYNDAYWFDQRGCSSPRVVVWRGDADSSRRASDDLFVLVHEEVRAHGYAIDTGAVLAKLRFSCEAAIDHGLLRYRTFGNELMVATLDRLGDLGSEHPGAGFFFEARVEHLEELASLVDRRHQTIGHFGFARVELEAFIRSLAGRGIDRVVPIGSALQFGRYWDGYDLLRAFSRVVWISDSPTALGTTATDATAVPGTGR